MMVRLLKGNSSGNRYSGGRGVGWQGVTGATLGSLDTSWSLSRALLSGNNQLPAGPLLLTDLRSHHLLIITATHFKLEARDIAGSYVKCS